MSMSQAFRVLVEAETKRAKGELKPTMAAVKQKIPVAEIVRSGEKLIVPASLTLRQAMEVLQRQEQYEEQETAVVATIDCLLYEGAWAFHQACSAMFGWVRGVPTPGFFGPTPPAMLTVPISRTESVQVAWGGISLPTIEGRLDIGAQNVQGRLLFRLQGLVKRKHEGAVQRLIDDTRRRVREESLYRGKAFKLRFRTDDGEPLPLPEPKFLNLEQAPVPEALIFNTDVARAIETNLFTLVRETEAVKAAGVPLKRGVLLSGTYGTGKSLTAAAMARLCEEHGWTFVECERADEIGTVLKLAQQYGRTVVFCEDIDSVLSGNRSVDMNDILNIIDGVDAKSAEVLTCLTTNDADAITKAMIRPGRIDAVIDMLPPDAEAAQRLVRLYAGDRLPAGEDLTGVGESFAGQIPSMIRDMVEIAKLYAISRGDPAGTISAAALLEAAQGKEMQRRLLEGPAKDRRSEQVKAATILAEALAGNGSRPLAAAGAV